MEKVIDTVVAVTYRCNARCVMCEIWKKTDHFEAPPKTYRNLSPTLKHVNITGGEPFLRNDVVEIVKIIKQACPKTQIIFSTNGLLTEKIVKDVQEIQKFYPKIGVRVSLDGIGEKHDYLRGVSGAYNLAISTLKELKKIGVKNLGIGFTAMEANLDQIIPVFKLSQKFGIDFSLALAQSSEFFFGNLETQKINNLPLFKKNLEYLVRNHLLSSNPKMWGRAFFEYGAWKFIFEGKRVLPDGAGVDSCFIDPKGNVYPSNYTNEIMGNITKSSLDQIWELEKAWQIRAKIKKEKRGDAWMICTLRGSFQKNLLKVLLWVLKNKIKIHLNQEILC